MMSARSSGPNGRPRTIGVGVTPLARTRPRVSHRSGSDRPSTTVSPNAGKSPTSSRRPTRSVPSVSLLPRRTEAPERRRTWAASACLEPGVHGDEDGARQVHAEARRDPPGAVGGPERHPIARSDPRRHEGPGDGSCLVPELQEGPARRAVDHRLLMAEELGAPVERFGDGRRTRRPRGRAVHATTPSARRAATSSAARSSSVSRISFGVLAHPGHARVLRPRGGVDADRVARNQDGWLAAVRPVDADQHVVRDDMGVRRRAPHRAGKDRRRCRLPPVPHRPPLGSCRPAHCSIAGRRTVSRWSIQPWRSARRGSDAHSGWPTISARRSKWCSRPTWIDEPAVAGPEPMVDDGTRVTVLQAHRPEVGDDVRHGDHGIEHGHVDVLGAVRSGRALAARPGCRPRRRARRRCPRAPRPATPTAARRLPASSRRCPTSPRRWGRRPGGPGTATWSRCRTPRPTRRRNVGCTATMSSKQRPSRAIVPARKFSATTSKRGAMSSTSWRPRSVLEVDADAPFAEVVAQEGGAEATTLGVADRRLRGAAQFPARRLDLDHVGAEPGQELRGEGQRLHLFERQHPDADQRPGRAAGPKAQRPAGSRLDIISVLRQTPPGRGPWGMTSSRRRGNKGVFGVCGRTGSCGAERKRGTPAWQVRCSSKSMARWRPSRTTMRTNTMRSTTPWTPSCSTCWPSCAADRTCGRSSGGERGSRSRPGGTSVRWAARTVALTHHELMRRGHRGIRAIFELDAPVIVALQGWAIGASFQRALLCDIRVAAEGARFMLPEVGHGVIPDTGGVARLFQMCGHGVVADLVLTGRVMPADEAFAHGIVSRVVPPEKLDEEVRAIAEKIAEAPAVTVRGRTPDPGSSGGARGRRGDGRGDDRADLHRAFRRHGRNAGGPSRGPSPGLPRELIMSGLPEPPPVGASALPAGTFDGGARADHGRRDGSRQGHRRRVRPARRRPSSSQVASRSTSTPAPRPSPRPADRSPTVTCDIREPDQVAAAFDAAEEAFGLPTVLVNNAAANFPVPAEDMSPNAWRTVVDITLNGTFFCSREFARRHIAADAPGSIVDVGASYAWTGGPGFAHSAAAKAGVKIMVETLAVEWGPYGIQVNGLVPGLFPHEDMTADIRGNLDRTSRQGHLPAGAASRAPARAGVGRDVPRLAVRPFRLGPRPGRRRRELAAQEPDQSAGGHCPRADGSPAVRPRIALSVTAPHGGDSGTTHRGGRSEGRGSR